MNDNALSRSDLFIGILGFAATVLVLAVLSEFDSPLTRDFRLATIALGVIGIAMCLVGGLGNVIKTRGWTSTSAALGIILGVMALLIIGHACCDYWLPLIDSDRTGFLALAILIAAKIAVMDIPWDKQS